MILNRVRSVLLLGLLSCVGLGCETAYYGLNEQFGILKNDLLVERVEEAMEAQEDAKEEFKSAFEQFEAVVGVPDTELKSVYQDLNDAFEDSKSEAEEVSERIAAVEDVSEDLFEEWEEEIGAISSPDLRRRSSTQLRTSKTKYASLIQAMKKAESRMQPVLTSFQDHVLFLKHNLNAQAISSLKSELGSIESSVGRLIQDMESSINEAQSFIDDMAVN